MSLGFLAAAPWSPSAESRSVQAQMGTLSPFWIWFCVLPSYFLLELPFGFNLAIADIQNDFNLTQGGRVLAGLKTVSQLMRHIPFFFIAKHALATGSLYL